MTHGGQGSNPVASPTNSNGCPAGYYLAGETVNMSGASAASGWQISGWTGTKADGSTVATNTVIIPSGAHTVSVNYTPILLAFVVTTDWHTWDYLENVTTNLQQIKAWIDNPTSDMPAPSFMVITGDFTNVNQTQAAITNVLGPEFVWYPESETTRSRTASAISIWFGTPLSLRYRI